MNETAASLVGKEIGNAVIARFYPELLAAQTPVIPTVFTRPGVFAKPQAQDTFDFNAEMRETRVNADALLAAGKIEDAEQYMELRRLFLWDNGYRIRKLNQAYFAFYGAYADSPGGAAELIGSGSCPHPARPKRHPDRVSPNNCVDVFI